MVIDWFFHPLSVEILPFWIKLLLETSHLKVVPTSRGKKTWCLGILLWEAWDACQDWYTSWCLVIMVGRRGFLGCAMAQERGDWYHGCFPRPGRVPGRAGEMSLIDIVATMFWHVDFLEVLCLYPSRKHLQKCLGRGYVSSQEGISLVPYSQACWRRASSMQMRPVSQVVPSFMELHAR